MEKVQTIPQNPALGLVQMAIQSGAVKLLGPGADETSTARNAERDALYLLTLYTRLTSPKQPG